MFECKLEQGNHVVEISVESKTVNIAHHCFNEAQAEQIAKSVAKKHMQTKWKLVELNGKKVKQGKLVIPDARTISKIEKAPAYIKPRIIRDGTVGEQE